MDVVATRPVEDAEHVVVRARYDLPARGQHDWGPKQVSSILGHAIHHGLFLKGLQLESGPACRNATWTSVVQAQVHVWHANLSSPLQQHSYLSKMQSFSYKSQSLGRR